MEPLEILHQVESLLGFDLDMKTGDDIIEYLRDDPVCTDPHYLIELFDLHIPRGDQ